MKLFIVFIASFLVLFQLIKASGDGENCVGAECKSLPKCSDVLSKDGFTGKCRNRWEKIKPLVKPTQPEVGYGWVKLKVEKDYQTEKDAEINTKVAPAVIGPSPDGPRIYIVDDHHTLCALDYSGFKDVTVIFNILCDKRDWSYDDFWASLARQNLAYLGAHPTDGGVASLAAKISWYQVPTYFSFTKKDKSLADDPWRSLAGYSRKVESADCPKDNKRCNRCMYRGCKDGAQDSGSGVAFFEFRWGYFMTIATYVEPWKTYWPTAEDYSAFISAFEKVSTEKNLDKIDTGKWKKAAAAIVPLCRSDKTAQYVLPDDIYALIAGTSSNTLPGYVSGNNPINSDPTCDSPHCADEAKPEHSKTEL